MHVDLSNYIRTEITEASRAMHLDPEGFVFLAIAKELAGYHHRRDVDAGRI